MAEHADERLELWRAISDLERDYAMGTRPGVGYRYVEASPDALRTVLDSIRSHPWVSSD